MRCDASRCAAMRRDALLCVVMRPHVLLCVVMRCDACDCIVMYFDAVAECISSRVTYIIVKLRSDHVAEFCSMFLFFMHANAAGSRFYQNAA